MAEIGTVIEVMPRKVKVRIPHSDRCKGCHACSFIAADAQMELIALNHCNAKIGDKVSLSIERSGELPASLLLYGVPMAFFIITLLLLLTFAGELVAFLGAIIMTAIAYLLVRKLSGHMDTSRYLPTATEIIEEE